MRLSACKTNNEWSARLLKKYHVSMDQLSTIAVKLFAGMGYAGREAAYAADVLVETNRRGVDTHGVARLEFYNMLVSMEENINKNAQLNIIRDEPPYLMVDADRGLGIIMAPQAVELAINRASEQGICVMGIRNSSHFGAAGYYADKCARQGYIALVSSNSGATMAPYGGREKILGNSPWSIAVPGGNRHPDHVMFDMACSEVSRGKCETAMREGRQVPIGWGIDKNGEPSTDPAAILWEGCLLPFGGIKGYCIALLVEVLSSMVTFASQNENDAGGVHEGASHFVLLLDPGKFGSMEAYKNSIDSYVDQIKNTPLANGVSEIIVPGELEARSIRMRTEKGMELDEAVASSLVAVARERGLLTADQGVEALCTVLQ